MTHKIGFGAYHTAVEVYGQEFQYGAHAYNESGISANEPMQQNEFIFRERIRLGKSQLGFIEIQTVLQQLDKEFLGTNYDLFMKNCNHFSFTFAEKILQDTRQFPLYVFKLTNCLNYLRCILPKFVLNGGIKKTQNEVELEEKIKENIDSSEGICQQNNENYKNYYINKQKYQNKKLEEDTNIEHYKVNVVFSKEVDINQSNYNNCNEQMEISSWGMNKKHPKSILSKTGSASNSNSKNDQFSSFENNQQFYSNQNYSKENNLNPYFMINSRDKAKRSNTIVNLSPRRYVRQDSKKNYKQRLKKRQTHDNIQQKLVEKN
ncbi:hypothetical protein PPERSA_07957 [Pseudocohnilembus persalinus]|uniref:PPPDE domain-containing protein n=1 Tax=Pseudocohnilembus persalinus TaxID=266149 RepID=A0A0V0QBA4_PSEPJ|nr:hypothetical protein PPERSA_07957 [Pseudocohnilembus persalinus]|eukprot:KRW99472.1 hypothetical protein PPERSA_07957 [Pseudocohnilembus persalinus]